MSDITNLRKEGSREVATIWEKSFGEDGCAIYDEFGTVATIPIDLTDWKKHAALIAATPTMFAILKKLAAAGLTEQLTKEIDEILQELA